MKSQIHDPKSAIHVAVVAEYYRIGHWAFKLINRSILVLGLVILYLIVKVVDHSTFADDGFISEAWPAAYGMLQFLPLML